MALDGIGEKLKSFFKSKEDSKFKGQGRKLGSAETQSSGNPGQPRGFPVNSRSGTQSSGDGALLSSGHAVSQLQPPPQPLGPGSRPSLLVSRSHRTEDVVLDAAVMVSNTPTGREASLVASTKLPGGPGALHPGSPTSPAASYGTASPTQPASPCTRVPTAGAAAQGSGQASAAASARTNGAVGGGGGRRSGDGSLTVEVPRSSAGGRSSGGGRLSGGQRQERDSGGRLQSKVTSGLSSMVSTISTPTAAEKRIGGGFRCHAPPTDAAMADYGVAPASSEAYELQRCLALVLSYIPPRSPGAAAPAISPQATQPQPPLPAVRTGPPPPSLAGDSSSHTSSSAGASTSTSLSVSITAGDNSAVGAVQNAASGSASASCSEPQTPLTEGSGAQAAEAPAPAMVVAATAGGAAGSIPGSAAVSAGPRESCDALLRILRNVLTKPGEPKFRQIRLSNPKVQETIVGVPGAVEFLEAAGFRMEFKPDDGSETANEAYMVLPEEVPPTALAEAFRLLSAAMAAHGFTSRASEAGPAAAVGAAAGAGVASAPAVPAAAARSAAPTSTSASSAASRAAAAAAAAAAAPAVDRCTQVLLPAAPDVEVPDWFFQRTGAEIRAQWQAMQRQRQEAEQFMTRTMREVRRQQLAAAQQQEEDARAGEADTARADVATVRVRFPEGVCLQGQFGATEPVSRVFEWVAAALRSPALTFELIKPDRQPLHTTTTAATATTTAPGKAASAAARPRPASGAAGGALAVAMPLTVRSADLLPSVLLNLRPTGHEAAQLAAANVPMLSDQMLRTTRPQ